MIDARLAPYGALALRVALGVMFIAHAYLKLAVFTMPGFAGFLGSVGLPTALAWPIVLAELARRSRHPGRLPRPPRLGGAAARPPGCLGHSRAQRLAVHRAERRLGISGVPGADRSGAGADRRRRLRAAPDRAARRRRGAARSVGQPDQCCLRLGRPAQAARLGRSAAGQGDRRRPGLGRCGRAPGRQPFDRLPPAGPDRGRAGRDAVRAPPDRLCAHGRGRGAGGGGPAASTRTSPASPASSPAAS